MWKQLKLLVWFYSFNTTWKYTLKKLICQGKEVVWAYERINRCVPIELRSVLVHQGIWLVDPVSVVEFLLQSRCTSQNTSSCKEEVCWYQLCFFPESASAVFCFTNLLQMPSVLLSILSVFEVLVYFFGCILLLLFFQNLLEVYKGLFMSNEWFFPHFILSVFEDS